MDPCQLLSAQLDASFLLDEHPCMMSPVTASLVKYIISHELFFCFLFRRFCNGSTGGSEFDWERKIEGKQFAQKENPA